MAYSIVFSNWMFTEILYCRIQNIGKKKLALCWIQNLLLKASKLRTGFWLSFPGLIFVMYFISYFSQNHWPCSLHWSFSNASRTSTTITDKTQTHFTWLANINSLCKFDYHYWPWYNHINLCQLALPLFL